MRQFKYDTVYNVVLQLPYTSLDGGTQLQGAADNAAKAYMKRMEDYAAAVAGFAAVLDLKIEGAKEEARDLTGSEDVPFSQPIAEAGARVGIRVGSPENGAVRLDLGDMRPRLPFFTVGQKISVVKLYLLLIKI